MELCFQTPPPCLPHHMCAKMVPVLRGGCPTHEVTLSAPWKLLLCRFPSPSPFPGRISELFVARPTPPPPACQQK